MRVTAAVKNETRERILSAAAAHFEAEGFAQSTTRDIARAAGIGVGTLFNYFPTKEAMAGALVQRALAAANDDSLSQQLTNACLEEHLFALVATELRHLRPLRGLIRPLLDVADLPLAGPAQPNASLRQRHLALVESLLVERRPDRLPSAVALQLYWTLYAGVLTFWSSDDSPHQEDTLALLDETIRMFVTWLDGAWSRSEPAGAGPPLDKGAT
jgi:AcrR family transcriptional regulator